MGKAKLENPKPSGVRRKTKAEDSSSAVPSADELTNSGSNIHVSGRRAAPAEIEDATLHLYELDYCSDGSVYGDQFEGPMTGVHLVYMLYPSLIYQARTSISNYLKEKHDERTSPKTWRTWSTNTA